MSPFKNTKVRNFHQAKWDEPIIFELGTKGERGILLPDIEEEIESVVGNGFSKVPKNMIRERVPSLPEVSQMQVLKHFLRLSQETLGADLNVDIGQGTCTMKYSPKINELLAASPKLTELHPSQPLSTVQGILEIFYKTDLFLREISGLDHFTLQPASGSQAILTMSSIIKAFHDYNEENTKRDEIITTIFSHPSDAAAPAVQGYKIIDIYPNSEGLPDIEALREAISDRTAGLLITNPEDTGIYNPRIKDFTSMIHEVGGLCGYDQANANGILGIARAKEAGFDMCFFNLHKTFSSPHGCGGPSAGALGVIKELMKFLPVPLVSSNGSEYYLDYNVSHTIGKVRSYYGVVPAVLKAYSWIMSLGREGVEEVSKIAVLNNNYLLKKVLEINGTSAPYAKGHHRIEQVRYSWNKLTEETGITTEDITNRMVDFGFHMWSSHHPFIVPQPFTLEPTESYSKAEIDEYIAGLAKVAKEAYTDPNIVKNAPHRSVVHKLITDSLDDPDKWAITWRAYLKKWKNDPI
ncbi:MAG: aminomethyl-transferring glycine dehydrogenase subunit GcvPB [Candidatus Hodarchaeales archaeon]|jgi:glycine dehydrogenase subunit 2